jgi:hypothetical protein
MDMANKATRKPILAVLAFYIALLLAVFSVLLSITTFGLDVEISTLLWAWGLAIISSIGLAWYSLPRMPTRLRFLGFAVAGLAAMGGLCSASRFLG